MSFDNTNTTDLQALQDEVNLDPISMIYSSLPLTDTKKLLNALNEEESNIELPKPTSGAIFDHQTLMETWYPKGVTNEMLPWIEALVQEQGDITQYKAKYILDCGSDSLAALNAIIIPLSRAEVLWGQGTVITDQDWILSRDYQGA